MRGMRSLRSLSSIGLAVAALSHGSVLAGPPPSHLVRVGISLERPAAAASPHAPAMVVEADAIWRLYGVSIALIDPSDAGALAACDVQLSLSFAPPIRRVNHPPGLGAIWFQEGTPGSTLTIDAEIVAAMVRETPMNRLSLDAFPPALADQMVRRALGRVLAHEIGHFLLASPAHSRSGLMRPSFSGRLLGEFDRTAFRLDASALPRLRARLARLESIEMPRAAVAGDEKH